MFDGIRTVTAKEDLLSHLRLRLLVHLARKHGCTKMFLGDNATRVAINILALTSQGRGYTLPFEGTFSDKRFEGLELLRPMRDILSKEVGLYNHLQHVASVPLPTFTSLDPNPKASITHLTEDFVTTLQQGFPSTVGAITKTVEKFNFSGDLGHAVLCVISHL